MNPNSKFKRTTQLCICLLNLALASNAVLAADPTSKPAGPLPLADVAAPKTNKDGSIQNRFKMMHDSFLARGKAGKIGLLFLGDSITEGWGHAPEIWNKYYGSYDPANFGISGDQTEHVLWRIDNGELDGISPRVLVLMIGTNNIGDTAENITRGDLKIIQEIHQKLPDTKLLVLGIFPRGADPENPQVQAMRDKLKAVNTELAKLDDGKMTRFLDIGDKFLSPDGLIRWSVMNDALHPTPKGYQIWADAMQPLLDQMMK